MGDFFHGWRRKLGCVTLLLALVFMGGWIRSRTVTDSVQFPSGSYIQTFFPKVVTSWDRFIVATFYSKPPIDDLGLFRTTSQFVDIHRLFDQPFNEWRFRYCGFAVGETTERVGETTERIWMVVIPYWSIAIPLTLLSAYLLLSKPRKSTPKKMSDPTSSERA